MHAYTEIHRRMVLNAYHRFLAADRSLQKAQSAALSWIPEPAAQKTMIMGDPGSRVRQLHDRRDRALARLTLFRQALSEDQRGRRIRKPRVLLIEARPI